jgi:hypothetical protein
MFGSWLEAQLFSRFEFGDEPVEMFLALARRDRSRIGYGARCSARGSI